MALIASGHIQVLLSSRILNLSNDDAQEQQMLGAHVRGGFKVRVLSHFNYFLDFDGAIRVSHVAGTDCPSFSNLLSE
jgi:hypothetical protein